MQALPALSTAVCAVDLTYLSGVKQTVAEDAWRSQRLVIHQFPVVPRRLDEYLAVPAQEGAQLFRRSTGLGPIREVALIREVRKDDFPHGGADRTKDAQNILGVLCAGGIV